MGRPKKVSTVITSKDSVNENQNDPFTQNLKDELKEKKESLAKYKKPASDVFTKILVDVFELECDPAFKLDFTDPRWPRNEKGDNVSVERVYFLGLRGPREAKYGFRALGEQEINGDAKIIVDRIPEGLDEKFVKAKKWLAEQSFYRYFWIRENEEFEFENEKEVQDFFLKRFEPLKEKPDFTYGPIAGHMSLVMNNPNGQWVR